MNLTDELVLKLDINRVLMSVDRLTPADAAAAEEILDRWEAIHGKSTSNYNRAKYKK